VADALDAPLDLVVPRKIGAPFDPEYAIGALTESGDVVWNEAERAGCDPEELEAIVEREKSEAQRRLSSYRRGLPERDFKGKTVILIDDGAATGYTMRAAIASVRRRRPARIVVALPTCSSEAKEALSRDADETVILDTPALFGAVGASYEAFPQVKDGQVIKLMHHKT
jgi:putative phosphoribosyl transferase